MTEFLRWYVVVVAVLVIVVGTPHLLHRWRNYRVENQMAWLAIVLFNLATLLGTLEALWRETPGGYRNYLFAIAETWLLAAVSYEPVRIWRAWRARHTEERT